MFGKDIAENFVFMLTFCDGGNPQFVEALQFAGSREEPPSCFLPLIKAI